MLGLSSEVSLPPVSKLCEEFDCVPAAGAAACPANENALSLLSSSAIDCEVRSYPLAGSVGDLRLITCELQLLCDLVVIDMMLLVQRSRCGKDERSHGTCFLGQLQLGTLSQRVVGFVTLGDSLHDCT